MTDFLEQKLDVHEALHFITITTILSDTLREIFYRLEIVLQLV